MKNAGNKLKSSSLEKDGSKLEKKVEARPESEHFIRPKLSVTLKLEVANVPLADRPVAQEVAETLEEMLTLLHDKGGKVDPDTHLPPRGHRLPGKTMNQAR